MFASIYDLLMQDIDYNQLVLFLKQYIKKEDLILDAGCGSGFLLSLLLKESYTVIGIDYDTRMLSIARNRLEENKLDSSVLYEHDLRNSIPIQVNVIYAFFDVINYFKGSKKVFKNFYNALSDQGYLIFDIYDEEKMQAYDGYYEEEVSPIKYQWYIQYQSPRLMHKVQTEHQIYKIKQYVYATNYYKHLLEEIGFSVSIVAGPDSRKKYLVAKK